MLSHFLFIYWDYENPVVKNMFAKIPIKSLFSEVMKTH